MVAAAATAGRRSSAALLPGRGKPGAGASCLPGPRSCCLHCSPARSGFAATVPSPVAPSPAPRIPPPPATQGSTSQSAPSATPRRRTSSRSGWSSSRAPRWVAALAVPRCGLPPRQHAALLPGAVELCRQGQGASDAQQMRRPPKGCRAAAPSIPRARIQWEHRISSVTSHPGSTPPSTSRQPVGPPSPPLPPPNKHTHTCTHAHLCPAGARGGAGGAGPDLRGAW